MQDSATITYLVRFLKEGSEQTRVVSAPSKIQALYEMNQDLGIRVIHISVYQNPKSFSLSRFFSYIPAINQEAYIDFLRECYVMLDAGISIFVVFNEMVHAIEDKRLKFIFEDILEEIESGQSLTYAFSKYTKDLGIASISFIRLGESTGNLPQAIERLIGMLEASSAQKKRFAKAMFYPLSVLVSVGIAFIVLISYVLPKFKDVYANLGADLPLPTRILLSLDSFFIEYGVMVFVGAIILLFSALRMYRYDKRIRYFFDKKVLSLPLYGKALRYRFLGKFTLMLHELIHAGVSISEAIGISLKTIDNSYMQQKMHSISDKLSQGLPLYEALEQTQVFESKIIQMIKAGEYSGNIDGMLKKISYYYHDKFRTFIDNISSYIEPLMIFVIGLLVLMLALGIFMPMWNMTSVAKVY